MQCVASAGLIAPHAWQYIEVETLAFTLLAISAPSHLHCRRQYIVPPVTTSRTSTDQHGRDTSESRPVKPILDCWPALWTTPVQCGHPHLRRYALLVQGAVVLLPAM